MFFIKPQITTQDSYYHEHLTNEEIEIPKFLISCPTSHSKKKVDWDFNSNLSDLSTSGIYEKISL